METRICKTCNKEKEISKFETRYHECRACRMAAYRRKRNAETSIVQKTKICTSCNTEKEINKFEKGRNICTRCRNIQKGHIAPKITKICKTCKKEKEIGKFEKGYTECMACRKKQYRRKKDNTSQQPSNNSKFIGTDNINVTASLSHRFQNTFVINCQMSFDIGIGNTPNGYTCNTELVQSHLLALIESSIANEILLAAFPQSHQNTQTKKKTNSRKIDARAFVTFQCKPLILKRDNFKCQLCNHNNIKNLHVHHILPVKHGSEDKYVVNPKNLITLCRECHKKAHGVSWKNLDVDIAQELIHITKEKESSNPTILPSYNPLKTA